MDKFESDRIQSEIREVLLKYWDPIGIKDEPRARDEYDMYIGGILGLLLRDATEEELRTHLWKIIGERIQVHPQVGATDNAVRALRTIKLQQVS
jgi:hypothetical protein